jgi:hypothetical protein
MKTEPFATVSEPRVLARGRDIDGEMAQIGGSQVSSCS